MPAAARAAAVGALAAALLLGPLAGAAAADPPGGTDSPTPTPTAASPAQVAPVTAPPAVTRIRFSPGADRVTVSWTGSLAAQRYTVQVRGADAGTFDTQSPRLELPQVPPGASLRVRIVAHGVGSDSPAATGSWTRPAAVPRVASAALTPTATGLRVTWVAAAGTPAGSRYLVRVQGADGTVLVRAVAGSAVGFAGIRRDTLYSGSITTEAPDGRRSPAYYVSAVMVPDQVAPPAADSPVPPPSGRASGEPTRGATAPVVPAVEPGATPSTVAASAPLISSPAVAFACALAAVLLGAGAITVLLRRRPRR